MNSPPQQPLPAATQVSQAYGGLIARVFVFSSLIAVVVAASVSFGLAWPPGAALGAAPTDSTSRLTIDDQGRSTISELSTVQTVPGLLSQSKGMVDSVRSAAPTVSESPVQFPGPVALDTTAALLMGRFAESWARQDWESMASFASSEVVHTASGSVTAGGSLQWLSDSDNGCQGSVNFLACPALYTDPDGNVVIFDLVVTHTESGSFVSDLIFGGSVG